jgi:hypothetical protein
MIEPARRNWPAIIAEIMAWSERPDGHRLTPYKLSVLLGCDKKTIAAYMTHDGPEPRHWQGELLLALHARYRPATPQFVRGENIPISSTLASA